MNTKSSVETQCIASLSKTLHLFIICCLLLSRPSSAQVANGTGAGKCLSYDGVNDYVQVSNNSIFNLTTAWTCEAWVKRNGTAGNNSPDNSSWKVIVRKGVYETFQLMTRNTDWIIDVGLYNGTTWKSVFSTTGSGLTQGEWYYIVGTYDNSNGGTLKVYINGVLENTSTSVGTPSTNTNALWFAGNNSISGVSSFWSVSIDELRIWNRALTQTEIRDNMCKKLTGSESGLVGYWRFDEGSGGTAYDASGNGNNGTLY